MKKADGLINSALIRMFLRLPIDNQGYRLILFGSWSNSRMNKLHLRPQKAKPLSRLTTNKLALMAMMRKYLVLRYLVIAINLATMLTDPSHSCSTYYLTHSSFLPRAIVLCYCQIPSQGECRRQQGFHHSIGSFLLPSNQPSVPLECSAHSEFLTRL